MLNNKITIELEETTEICSSDSYSSKIVAILCCYYNYVTKTKGNDDTQQKKIRIGY